MKLNVFNLQTIYWPSTLLATPCWYQVRPPFGSRTALILLGKDSTSCWKYFLLSAAHSWCKPPVLPRPRGAVLDGYLVTGGHSNSLVAPVNSILCSNVCLNRWAHRHGWVCWVYYCELPWIYQTCHCIAGLRIIISGIKCRPSRFLPPGWRVESFSPAFQLSIRSSWSSWRRLQPQWKGKAELLDPHTRTPHHRGISHILDPIIGLIWLYETGFLFS